MSYQTVTYQKEGYVSIVNLRGPANDILEITELSSELSELCGEISCDREIRVVVFTGSGDNPFSMGEDLFKRVLEADNGFPTKWWSISEPVIRIDRPVIAAINGDIVGNGLELALACDLLMCSEGASFAMPQVTWGGIPWDGGTQRLSRLVGKAKAIEMILLGEKIDAQEANRIGLVNRIVPPEQLSGVVMEIAQEIASKGPVALCYAKEAIHKGMDLTLEQGLRLEADLYLSLHTTKDRTEGIMAFQEKRKAQFEGK
jgi:enoyl-CoA hydratase/carnithine racemase